MSDIDYDHVPRVTLVFNGPLKMSPGKMAAQAFQACQRLHLECSVEKMGGCHNLSRQRREALAEWHQHTTTIARVAKTTAMFERVCSEVPGVVMVDEGFTEVQPETPTVFASWPCVKAEEHKLLSNAKVQLLRDAVPPFSLLSDEQLQTVAFAFSKVEYLQGSSREAFEEAAGLLRAEAAARHLHLPDEGGLVASDLWLL